jgi:hypothetical protein
MDIINTRVLPPQQMTVSLNHSVSNFASADCLFCIFFFRVFSFISYDHFWDGDERVIKKYMGAEPVGYD